MKIKRSSRLIAWLLALVMVIGIAPVSAFAQEGQPQSTGTNVQQANQSSVEIIYDTNGEGMFADGATTFTSDASQATLTADQVTPPVEGLELLGWKTEDGNKLGLGQEIKLGTLLTTPEEQQNTKSITLYPIWPEYEIPSTYTASAPLYNVVNVFDSKETDRKWYKLAKSDSDIQTKQPIDEYLKIYNLTQTGYEEKLDDDEYDPSSLEPYNFPETIEFENQTYVYSDGTNTSELKENYYTAELLGIWVVKNKIGGSNGYLNCVVPESERKNYGNPSCFVRKYKINLHLYTGPVDQVLNNYLTVNDKLFYRLKVTMISGPKASEFTNGTKTNDLIGLGYTTPNEYDFSNVVLQIGDQTYTYSESEKTGIYDNYFTVKKKDPVFTKKNVIHSNAATYNNEDLWLDGAKESYEANGITGNNYESWHRDYVATLHEGNRPTPQPLYNMITLNGENAHGEWWRRLKVTSIDTKPATSFTKGKVIYTTDGHDNVTPSTYDFSGYKIEKDGITYLYQGDVDTEDPTVSWFGAEVYRLYVTETSDPRDYLNESDAATYEFEPEKGSLTYHRDYKASFHPATEAKYTVHYYLEGTTTSVADDYIGQGKFNVTVKAPDASLYDAYTAAEKVAEPASIKISKNKEENVITVYYKMPAQSNDEDDDMYIIITSSWPTGMPAYEGTRITYTANLHGFEGKAYTLQWQYLNGNEWVDEVGATGKTFTYSMSETYSNRTWRVEARNVRDE